MEKVMEARKMDANRHFGIKAPHRTEHNELTTCKKYGCISMAQSEIAAAREYEELKKQYEAEYDAAYQEDRDADENTVFELSVKMIGLCERFGWEIPSFLK
jgi:hypothetical protein